MTRLFTLIPVLLLCCGASASDDWPEGSAMQSGSMAVSEKHRYQMKSDEILSEIYTLLNNSYQEEAIRKQVASLRQYAASACGIVGISSGAGGSWPSTYAAKCETGIAYEHYRSLRNSLSCVKRLDKKSHIDSAEKMNCLIQSLNTRFFK